MRKMTKTVAVLAAMSAMTVASASMAFAATGEVKNLKALNTPEEVAAAGEGAGTWSGSNQDGWKFKTEDGTQLKNTWAQIDGVWYYFDGEKAVQDHILYIDGASYYFDNNGTLATGWQKITSKMDAYDDIEIPDGVYFDTANAYVDVNDAYDYEDYIWCYFHEDGKAAENEWFQSPESGLWYYFDENVMIKNIYNYEITPTNYDVKDTNKAYLYGFDKEGAMLIGWNYKSKEDAAWNKPTAGADGKTWYYYNSNGKMQEAGWKQIDGDWYLFADYSAASDAQVNGYPLIVNSYVKSAKSNGDFEYFYLNADGKMQKGVTTIPKKAWKVTFYTTSKDVTVTDYETNKTPDATIEVNLGSKGAATAGVVGNRYYTIDCTNTFAINDTGNKVNNSILTLVDDTKFTFAVTGTTVSVSGSAFSLKDSDVKGELVKSAFIGSASDALYMADKNGNFVTNKAVAVVEDLDVDDDGDGTPDKTYAYGYILFGSNGKAVTNYSGKKKSITVGGRTYWATEYTLDKLGKAENVTIFVSNKDEVQ